MKKLYTSTLEVGKMYRDYVKEIDSINSLNVMDLVSEYEDHCINCYTPVLMIPQLMSNFALLFPMLFEGNNGQRVDNGLLQNDLLKEVPDFFMYYDKDGKIVRAKGGAYKKDSNCNTIKVFRDSLEHGTYDLEYDNVSGEIYMTYSFCHDNQMIYKKLSVKTIMKIANFMIGKYFSPDNKLEIALINNMKLINGLIMQFNDKEKSTNPKSKYIYELKDDFLSPVLMVNDYNKNSVLEDIKLANVSSIFYSVYQHRLENLLGPSLFKIKEGTISDKDIFIGTLYKDSYYDFSNLSFDFSLLSGEKKDAADHISTHNIKQEICSTLLKNYKKYTNGEISPEAMRESNMRLAKRVKRLNKNIKNLEFLHHIRNAFAHGRVQIENGSLKIKDIHPVSGKETYLFNVSYDNMCKLISDENVRNIGLHITKKVA